jgi:hypothetical protein
VRPRRFVLTATSKKDCRFLNTCDVPSYEYYFPEWYDPGSGARLSMIKRQLGLQRLTTKKV